MQENNFEKQVQQKTDELRLKPSDEVWQKVAASITKKEGGRRVLIALALLLILTCSSIFIILQHSGDKNVNGSLSKNKTPGKTTQINEHIKSAGETVELNPATRRSSGEEGAIVKHLPSQEKQDTLQAVGNDLSLKTTPSVGIHKPANNNAALVHNNEQAASPKNKNKSRYKTPGAAILGSTQMDVRDEKTNLNNTSKIEMPETTVASNTNAVKEQVTDTISINPAGQIKQVSGAPLPLIANNKENVAGKDATPRSQKSKWKIGAKVSVGVANTQNGYLGIIGPASDEYKSFDAITIPSNGGNTGQNATGRYYPSKTKASTGIIFGLFVEKAISARTNFSAGLNYKAYNSSWMIGTRVDSASNLSTANYFYRNGSTHNYKNRFQFLELPVALRIKLGRQNKVPIYLNAGFSISRLLSSNALQFDTLSGTYYSDKTVFNKTIASVSGGLLFSLTPQSQNPLLIGPDISFSLNKMAQSGIFKDRHYSYFGVLVQRTLGKN